MTMNGKIIMIAPLSHLAAKLRHIPEAASISQTTNAHTALIIEHREKSVRLYDSKFDRIIENEEKPIPLVVFERDRT